MQWIIENGPALGAIILLVLRLAESVVALTPSEKDDKLVAKVGAIIKHFLSFGWKNG